MRMRDIINIVEARGGIVDLRSRLPSQELKACVYIGKSKIVLFDDGPQHWSAIEQKYGPSNFQTSYEYIRLWSGCVTIAGTRSKWDPAHRSRYSTDIVEIAQRLLKAGLVDGTTPVVLAKFGNQGQNVGTISQVLTPRSADKPLHLFHGTTVGRAREILANGLHPVSTTGRRQWKRDYEDTHAHRDEAVYLAASPELAAIYATRAVTNAKKHREKGQKPAILRVTILPKQFDSLRPDDDFLVAMARHDKSSPWNGEDPYSASMRRNPDRGWQASLSHEGQVALIGSVPSNQISMTNYQVRGNSAYGDNEVVEGRDLLSLLHDDGGCDYLSEAFPPGLTNGGATNIQTLHNLDPEHAEADERLRQHHGPVGEPDGVYDALDRYTELSGRYTRGLIAGGLKKGPATGLSADDVKNLKSVDGYVGRAKPLEHDLVVYSGLGFLPEGDTFTSPAFISTSIDPARAAAHANDRRRHRRADFDVIARFHLPAGYTGGRYLGRYSRYKGEAEFLLARGQTFTIIARHEVEVEDGDSMITRYVFDMEPKVTGRRGAVSENSLGKLFNYEGLDAVGYWYNPVKNKHVTIAWEASDGVDAHSDHADVPFEHPDWFGLSRETVEDHAEEIRGFLIGKGWARIGYNARDGMRIDAKNARIAQRSIRWFAEYHGVPSKVSVSITPDGSWRTMSHYMIPGGDVPDFIQSGRLEPAWQKNPRG